MRARLLTIAAALIVPIAIVGAQSRPNVDPPLDTVQFAPELEVDLAGSKRVTRGLFAHDMIVGAGRTANRGDAITVRYVGRLADGRSFTAPDEPPATFKLGSGEVIAGWERGLSGMRVGGRRQLVIAPNLGYGKKGSGPIPANAVLVFEIELLAVR